MLRLDANRRTFWFQGFSQDVRCLICQAFLHLRTAAKALNRAGKFANANNTPRWDIRNMHSAKEGEKVVLTDRSEWDVSNRHHVPHALFVGHGQEVSGILINAGKELSVHRRDARGCLFKANASRIISYGTKDVFYGAAYTLLINHPGIDGRSTRLSCSLAHGMGAQFIPSIRRTASRSAGASSMVSPCAVALSGSLSPLPVMMQTTRRSCISG